MKTEQPWGLAPTSGHGALIARTWHLRNTQWLLSQPINTHRGLDREGKAIVLQSIETKSIPPTAPGSSSREHLKGMSSMGLYHTAAVVGGP